MLCNDDDGVIDYKVACNVAAGEWCAAEDVLLEEHKNSVYFPEKPSKNSDLWKRFYSTAIGAVTTGYPDIAIR